MSNHPTFHQMQQDGDATCGTSCAVFNIPDQGHGSLYAGSEQVLDVLGVKSLRLGHLCGSICRIWGGVDAWLQLHLYIRHIHLLFHLHLNHQTLVGVMRR